MTVIVAGASTSFSSVLEALTTTVSSYLGVSSGFCSGFGSGLGCGFCSGCCAGFCGCAWIAEARA